MNVLNIVYRFCNKIQEKRLYWREYLSLQGFIYVYISKPTGNKCKFNWGDDLNIHLLELISGKKVIPYQCAFLKHKHYLCIGSILQWHSKKESIVWGTGLREPSKVCRPFSILAVRGPLTRQNLIEQGINCPEVYGDPALLLPRFYNPQIKQKYELGIIPHFSELKELTDNLRNEKAHIIDVQNYKKWTDFIDEILSCKVILSSSLHGVIVSDAYNIPNLWTKFTSYSAEADGFKFRDYYLSTRKYIKSPFCYNELKEINNLTQFVKNHWEPCSVDTDRLYQCCPFRKN